MVNKRFWLGMLVLLLTFVITVIGCDNESTDNGNGNKIDSEDNQSTGNEINNGNDQPNESDKILIDTGTKIGDCPYSNKATGIHNISYPSPSEVSYTHYILSISYDEALVLLKKKLGEPYSIDVAGFYSETDLPQAGLVMLQSESSGYRLFEVDTDGSAKHIAAWLTGELPQ